MKKLNTYSNISLLIAVIIMMTGINLFSQGKGKMNFNTPAKQMQQNPGADASKDYCIPFADCSFGDGFEIFVLQEIENLDSGCSPDGYGDFTVMQTPLTAGEEYLIDVVCLYGENNMSVWIDFDDDEVFAPDEMLVNDFFLANGGEVYEIPVTIPSDALSGFHRLRARGCYYMESASDPCADFIDGETEDYTVNITGGLYPNDVGIVSIDIEASLPPGPVEAKVTLKNFGTEPQTVQLSIINSVDYGTSAFVNDLSPGETRQITFAPWNAQIGTYLFHSYLSADDDNPLNNQLVKEVVVEQPNVPAPQNLSAEVISNSVLLYWEAPETKDLVGYNVYNSGILVASDHSELFYTDLCLAKGDYSYTVTAVYVLGESLPCDPVEVTIDYCDLLIITEAFENFSSGQQLVLQAQNMGIDYWQCWSMPPGSDEDPYISDDVVHNGSNSMLIEGLNDVTLELGAKTEGKYVVTFKIYVPASFDGYFGIWREVSSGSYGMEAYFNEDETGFAIIANSEWQAFTYDADTWNDVRAVIDLDNDWAKLYLNGLMMCQAQWSLDENGNPGPLKLDVIDFYAGVLWEGTPTSFVDDIEFKQIIDEALPPKNLEALVDGNNVLLSWDAPMEGMIEYKIQRNGDYLINTTELSFIDEGLEPGEYEYEVSSLYGDCESLPASPVIATIHPTQVINIPQGWSGLSSCIDPLNPDIETIFQPIIDQLIILQSETGMYWPGENVNSLIDWDAYSAYKIKMGEDVSLTFYGTWVSNKTVQLAEGWNIIPVLSECDVDVVDLFSGLDSVLVKEVAGSLIYWSEYGINSLEFLQSGKSYFVLMGSAGEIVFPECSPNPAFSASWREGEEPTNKSYNSKTGPNGSSWDGVPSPSGEGWGEVSQCGGTPLFLHEKGPRDEVVPSPFTHTIAIPTEVIDKNLIGNFLCAFNQNDFCCGCVFLSGNSDAITIYGDDPTTPELDGFTNGDPILFKIMNETIDGANDVEISLDPALPQHDGLFVTDGISAIKNLKTGTTSIQDKSNFRFNIYPNPASDYVCVDLQISGKLELFDMHGKMIKTFDVNQGINQVNVSMLEQGIYFIRISAGNSIKTERLIRVCP